MAEPNAAGLPAKLYFRIGEVADLVGVEPHVLRYWEREFRAIRPSKSSRGQRVYSRRDVENLMRVRDLLYGEGFTIAGAKRKLQQPAASAEVADAAQALLAVSPPEPDEAAAGTSGLSMAHRQLLAIREEIEAFLAELSPSSSD